MRGVLAFWHMAGDQSRRLERHRPRQPYHVPLDTTTIYTIALSTCCRLAGSSATLPPAFLGACRLGTNNFRRKIRLRILSAGPSAAGRRPLHDQSLCLATQLRCLCRLVSLCVLVSLGGQVGTRSTRACVPRRAERSTGCPFALAVPSSLELCTLTRVCGAKPVADRARAGRHARHQLWYIIFAWKVSVSAVQRGSPLCAAWPACAPAGRLACSDPM